MTFMQKPIPTLPEVQWFLYKCSLEHQLINQAKTDIELSTAYACKDRDYNVVVPQCHVYTFGVNYWWGLLLSAHQNDPALESSVQVLAEKVLELAPDYFAAQTKSLETAKIHIHLLKELVEYLKKRP